METVIDLMIILPFLGAGLTALTQKRRNFLAALTVSIEFVLAIALFWLAGTGPSEDPVCRGGIWSGFCGVGLQFAVDFFRSSYVWIAAFMWLVSTVFSFSYMKKEEHTGRYYFFLLFVLGATVGVFLSADLFTMFVFFELMSLASYVWVAQEENAASLRAAGTYLAVAVIGGLCILMGMLLFYQATGTLSTLRMAGIDIPTTITLPADGRVTAAGILMLIGFGAKAGVVPLHIWLPKAHPVAPAPASALLSGILTKTGVFGTMILALQILFGNDTFGLLLLVLGLLTMATGAVLALFSVNIKRTLACSSVSQIGFIFIGLGMACRSGNVFMEYFDTAEVGFLLHMVNHSLLKLLLFCIAGVIYQNTHKLLLDDVRGYGKKKPLLHVLFLAGAMGLAGVPLFNGYVSKSLIHESLILWQEIMPSAFMKGAEILFIVCGGLTAAYMLKLYIALFWEKNRDEKMQAEYEGQKGYMSKATAVLLSLTALFLPLIGIGMGTRMKVFSLEDLVGALLSLGIGAVVYLLVVHKWMKKADSYVDCYPASLDLENRVYRPLLSGLEIFLSTVCRFLDRLPDYVVVGLRKSLYRDAPLPRELEEGTFLTHAVGTLLDGGKNLLNSTLCRKRPIQISFEHRLALFSEEWKENHTMIGRSMSFGLLLFCLGFLLTLVYMLLI